LKIESAFCDVHPGDRLVRSAMKLAEYGSAEQQMLRCTHADCGRQFHYDFGYFPRVDGEEPDFGDLSVKPKCRKGHDLLYMLLTNIDGVPTYACFHPQCTVTSPYTKATRASGA
jgi:hypothetical protein